MQTVPRSYPALLAEEIFIVQMHGRDEEATRLEAILDEGLSSRLDGKVVAGVGLPKKLLIEILTLAETIRDRQKLGMHWSCCWRCQKYMACDERAARHKVSVRCNCCRSCRHFDDCSRKCLQ